MQEVKQILNKIKTNDKLIYVFSLGNPGEKYKHTRHNAGRIVCSELESDNYFEELCTKTKIKVKYFEPDTFMNDTGKYIKDKLRYAKENHKLVIVYDDIDIGVGEVKLSFGRSSGGHNGVESVISELGTKDFYRVRVGIGGKPIKEMLLQDYVLSRLSQSEIEILKKSKSKVAEIILKVITESR